jgi:hypothetical protein
MMDFNRRTFSAMLAGTVIAPRLSLAQTGAQAGAQSVPRRARRPAT